MGESAPDPVLKEICRAMPFRDGRAVIKLVEDHCKTPCIERVTSNGTTAMLYAGNQSLIVALDTEEARADFVRELTAYLANHECALPPEEHG